MSTSLYIISNIKISKKEVLAQKDIYLQKLKELQLDNFYFPEIDDKTGIQKYVEVIGEWEYELPKKYDEKTETILYDKNDPQILCFSSPTIFDIRVYCNCLELSTIYNYSFLYMDKEIVCFDEFRRDVFNIISIFGGTEIIYLADNGCDNLDYYLQLKVWDGVSYENIKKDIKSKRIPLTSDYSKLKREKLDYRNIKEIVFDDFKDYK